MSTEFEAPHPNGAGATGDITRARRIRRRVITAVLVVVGLAWGYALWFSVTRDSPEDLGDARDAVDAICRDARERLAALASTDLAARVEQENTVFEAMTGQLATVDVASGDVEAAYRAWIRDWDALIEARAAFARELRAEGRAQLETPKIDGKPISDRMNDYATQQGTDACGIDSLQAEVVDAERRYESAED